LTLSSRSSKSASRAAKVALSYEQTKGKKNDVTDAVYQPRSAPIAVPRCLLLPYFVSVGKRTGVGLQLARSSGSPAARHDTGRQTCLHGDFLANF